jgi:hypothetical protein
VRIRRFGAIEGGAERVTDVDDIVAVPAWRRAMDVARENGWAAALTALPALAAVAEPVTGPAGHVVLFPETGSVGTDIAGTVRATRVPGLAVLLRADGAAAADPGWAKALAGLRLGLSQWLLDEALEFLGARETNGAPLLSRDLVKGDVADVLLDHADIRSRLESVDPDGTDWAANVEVHQLITQADRRVLRLFGARGFVEGGPGTTAYVSELLADAYVGPATGRSGR